MALEGEEKICENSFSQTTTLQARDKTQLFSPSYKQYIKKEGWELNDFKTWRRHNKDAA